MSEPAAIDATAKIRSFVVSRFPVVKRRGLGDDDSLLDSGAVDSLGILDLVAFLEEEFGMSFDDDDLNPENFDSIAALTQFVQSKES